MKLVRWSSFLYLSLSFFSLSAQLDTATRFRIFNDPLKLLSSYGSLGVEYIVRHRFSGSIEFGSFLGIGNPDTVPLAERGSLVNGEVKVYSRRQFSKTPFRSYLGLEYRYLRDRQNKLIYFERKSPTSYESVEDKLGAVRTIKGLSLKAGLIWRAGNYFLDVSVGAGVQNRLISNIEREILGPGYRPVTKNFSSYFPRRFLSEYSGNHVRPSISFRAGICF